MCTICQAGFLLNSSTLCTNSCQARYYPDFVVEQCLVCPYDCYSCNSSGSCISCSSALDFRTLNNETSRCVCMQGYFDNRTSQCVACPTGCARCSSLSLCLNCLSTYYLFIDDLCYL
jgi:proprotein convertase subtilisin/kexin type 5